jgi:hypothetical protein
MKKHSMLNQKICSLLLFSTLMLGTTLAAQAAGSVGPHAAPAAPGKGYAIATLSARPPLNSARAAFNRADITGRGKLNRQELEHFPAMAPHFQLIDTNHDGFISFEELIRAASDQA